MRREVLGSIAIVVGAALILAAIAEVSSVSYPELRMYYWMAAVGLVTIIAGVMTWALSTSH